MAFVCVTVSFIIHSCFMTAGLRLQNALGFFKLLILILIVIVGIAHLAGVPGFELKGNVEVPDNLQWSRLWEGSGNGATAFVTGLYNVIWRVPKSSLMVRVSVILNWEKCQVFYRLL